MIIIKALVDNYSKDELNEIVKKSYSIKEVIKKLGYKTSNGSNSNTVMKRIKKYNISTEHFTYKTRIDRNKDNVFCINSTATQATLRKWYKKISDDSLCEICGQDKIWNDKPLSMTLDHIDGDNHNNELSNLRWICPNCGSQLPTFAGRNNKKRIDYIPVKDRKRKKKICPVCNINEINKSSKMCKDCRMKENRLSWPSKEDLEKLIYEKSFVQIGKIYGVTDNTVRKWCKVYELPFRYGELYKYIS